MISLNHIPSLIKNKVSVSVCILVTLSSFSANPLSFKVKIMSSVDNSGL